MFIVGLLNLLHLSWQEGLYENWELNVWIIRRKKNFLSRETVLGAYSNHYILLEREKKSYRETESEREIVIRSLK